MPGLTNTTIVSDAVASPVEVVGDVDVVLCSGQQEHDESIL